MLSHARRTAQPEVADVHLDGRSRVRVLYFAARQKPLSPRQAVAVFVPLLRQTAQMFFGTRIRPVAFALAFLFALACAQATALAQDDFEDDAADPVKLFNKGQDAHSKKNYEQAIELYEEALKLRPDFAEVEFQ